MGLTVAREALLVPSTLTDSAICVSAVLLSALVARVDIAGTFKRIAYTKSALGERLAERDEAPPVLPRCPDRQTNATVEKRHAGMQVLDEHAAAAHSLKHRRCVGNADQDEIRIAG